MILNCCGLLLNAYADGRQPDWDELAALLVMVWHFDQLEPLLPEDASKTIWQGTDGFGVDYDAARVAVGNVCSKAADELLHQALEKTLTMWTQLVKECTEESDSADEIPEMRISGIEIWEKFMGMEDDTLADTEEIDMDLSE